MSDELFVILGILICLFSCVSFDAPHAPHQPTATEASNK